MSNFAVTATYVLGPSGEQMTEFDSSGAWQHTNVFNGGQLLATYDTRGLHFPQTDPLGIVRVQVSDTGTPEKTCASLPLGDGQTCTGITDPTEHHFTGKERDAESGLDHFRFRSYSSNMSRWMSPDPGWFYAGHLKDPQSFNQYAYVYNNPLRFVHPFALNGAEPTAKCANILCKIVGFVENLFRGVAAEAIQTRTATPIRAAATALATHS